jgi:predicted DNA-binding protein YlxM (UPF0122 family)
MQDENNEIVETNEIWKSLNGIVECGDYYEVSNMGRVRSLDKRVNSRNCSRLVKGQIMKGTPDKDGYFKVIFYDKQNGKGYFVHRLVALAFIPNLENKLQVNHIDGNKQNCNLDNLEWVTSRENRIHAFKTGLQQGQIGENSPVSLLTDDKIMEIVSLYKTNNYSMDEIATLFDVNNATISNVINGKSWTHLKIEKHKRPTVSTELTNIEIVKKLHKVGYSQRKISRRTGFNRATVAKILNNLK